MIAVRVAKIVLVAALALHASLVAFGNITDYGTNFSFVQHVLSMDTIFPHSRIGYRAITNPALHHLAYALIIAAETLTAVLCWIGAWRLFAQLRSGVAAFNRAKAFAIAGLLMGLLVWQVGFMTICGRMVRDVDVADLERTAERVPACHDFPRRADFCDAAGR
jgi:predicted small integral membrane protein